MPQAAAIVLADGQATPVNVTFSPERVSPDLSTFSDKSGGVAIGFKRLTLSTLFTNSKRKVNRSRLAIDLPVISVVNGVSVVAYTLRANVEIILPDASTDADRKNLYAFLYNGLNHSLIKPALRDMDPLF